MKNTWTGVYLSCDVESKMLCIKEFDQYVVCMLIHVDFELKKKLALGEGLDGPTQIVWKMTTCDKH